MTKTVRTSNQAHKKAHEENVLLSGSIKKFFRYCSSWHPNVSLCPLRDTDGNLIDKNFSKAGNSSVFYNRTDVIMPTPVFAIDYVKKAQIALTYVTQMTLLL